MNDNVIDHVSLLLGYVMAFVIQVSNYVPRPQFTTAERRIESQERRIESLDNRGEENRIASLERQFTAISTISQRMWEGLDERGDLPEEPHDAREV